MARLPRLAIDHQLHLLMHRAAPGISLTAHEDDIVDLRDALLTVSREAKVAIHAYCVVPDRLILLLTPQHAETLSRMMQRLGRRFAGSYQLRHQHRGSPWKGRFSAGILQASDYLLDAMRLVEGAADRLGLGGAPGGWAGSSAAHHLGRRSEALITEHPLYWSLGNTPFEREAAYQRLYAAPLPERLASAMEDACLKGWVLGDAAYVEQLGKGQARRLLPQKAGRPKSHRHPITLTLNKLELDSDLF